MKHTAHTASDGPDDSWSSRDYLLRSVFCPPEKILMQLRNLHRRNGATATLLIGFDRVSILKSLTFAVGNDSDAETSLTEVLSATRLTGLESPIESSLEDCIAFLREKGVISESIAFGIGPPKESISSEGIHYWILSDRRTILDIDHAALQRFSEMLNGTLIANVRRDQRITRMVARTGAHDRPHGRFQRKHIEEITTLACEATGCDAAAFYLADGTSMNFHLLTKAGDSSYDWVPDPVEMHIDPSAQSSESRLAEHFSDYLRDAYFDSATYAYPSFPKSGRLPPLHEGHTANFGFVVVAVPFSPLGHRTPNIGLLALFRQGSDLASLTFSMFDLALMRNVSLRLSLLWSLLRTESAAREVAEFAASLANTPTASSALAEPEDQPQRVPRDFQIAAPLLRKLANELRTATHSSSVTIRALVAADGEHGAYFLLRRFIATPTERLKDGFADIPADGATEGVPNYNKSTNAFVAVTGRVAHIADSHKNLKVQCPGLLKILDLEERPHVRSVLTLPIVVDNVCVGTINMESSLPGAYSFQLEFCAALAALAGLALAASRASIVRALAQSTAQLGVGRHEAGKIEQALTKLLDSAPPAVKGDVSALANLVLRSPAEASAEQENHGTSDVRELLLQELRLLGEAPVTVHVASGISIPSRFVPNFRAAVVELFRNQLAYVDKDSENASSVRDSFIKLNGRSYLLLTFRNPIATLQRQRLLDWAYNAPIYVPGDPRPHIGCFTVGELMRHIGGSAHMRRGSQGYLDTILLLPTTLDEE